MLGRLGVRYILDYLLPACGGEVVVLTEDGSSYVWEQVRWPLKSRKGASLVDSLLPASCEVLAQAVPYRLSESNCYRKIR